MPNKEHPDTLDVLVWALKKLGADEYHFDPKGPDGGWELNIWEQPDDAPSNKEVTITREELEEFRHQIDNAFVATFGSKTTSPTTTGSEEALISFFLEPAVRPIFAKYLVRWRGQLGSSGRAKMEEMAIAASQESVRDAIVFQCLTDGAARLPGMVKRIEELRVLTARVEVPEEVQNYLEEASRCFVSGNFLACLIVCRSAIEFAMRDFLIREGKQRELDVLKIERGDTLFAMIRLARGIRWKLEPTLDTADDIRRAASDAVHNRVPQPEKCKEAFIKTRGFLKELYA